MITDIRLQNFRSYRDAAFELSPGVNIIVGPNASGKTNLLESILVIAHGGSYRAKDAELTSFDAEWARLDADLPESKRVVKIQKAADGRATKAFDIDGHNLSRLSVA